MLRLLWFILSFSLFAASLDAGWIIRKASTAGGSYPFSYDFESAGAPDAKWSSAGSATFDNTTTPLAGTEDLKVPATSSNYADWDLPVDRDSISIRYKIMWSATVSGNSNALEFKDSGGTTIARYHLRTNNTFRFYHGTATKDTGVLTPTSYVTFWVDWAKGTGTDGTADLYYAVDSTTKPGTPYGQITAGTATAQISSFRWIGLAGADLQIDDFTIDTNTLP